MALWGKHKAMVESWRFTGVNHRVAERTEDERTETTIPEAIGWAFLGWMKRNSERLCELCASVVNNPSSKIILLQYPDACIGDKGHAYST